jgi:hypothetical protein
MPWQLQFTTAAGAQQTVTFAQLAALEGGKVVADAWTVRFSSHKSSAVTLRLPGVPPHIAPAIPFESYIKIIDSTGTVQFAGYRTDRTGTADPRRASSSYVFEDAWYFLEHCPFQQSWLQSGGQIVPFQNVVLYQPNPGQNYVPAAVNGCISTGQQIKDILNWAILMGCPLQIGEIDPALYQTWYPLQNVTCGDAIKHCLRLHPDCFTEIDYTPTPPTFHIRQRGNLTAVTLPYSYTDAAGRRHTATDIQPRPELVPKRVALFYRIISSSYLLSTPVDIYPSQNLAVQGPVVTGQFVGGSAAPYTVGGTPVVGTAMTGITGNTVATIPVGAPSGLRALDFAIDLQGPKLSISTASITTAAFDPTQLNWWRKKVPALKQISQGGNIPNDGHAGALALLSTAINAGAAANITVLDDTGAAVNLATYAYELLPQSAPMAWMTVPGGGALQVIEATVTAHFSYTKQTPGASPTQIGQQNDHVHHVRVKLCNSPSATGQYTQYLTTGEGIPPNLAQNVYNSLATLQYNLTHTIVERPFNGWIKPGKHAVNLSGGAAAWTAMQATIQQTDYKMHLDGVGNTFDNFTVKCGPVEHLEPGELVQLFNVFANRDLTKIDCVERLTGVPAGGNTIAMPSDTAQENSVPGVEIEQQRVQLALTTPTDPTSAPTGQINSDAGLVAGITAGKTPYNSTTTAMQTMQPREFAFCDSTGNVYYAVIHATAGHTAA